MRFSRALAVILFSGLALRAGPVDLKQLDHDVFDRLAQKAKSKVEINLSADLLKFAAGMFEDPDDKDAARLKRVISGLNSITVRNYEFKSKGDYSPEDVRIIHQQIQAMNWNRVVDATDKEEEEHSEVYIMPGKTKPGGVFILVTEPLELTMVYILGNIDVNDLAALEDLGVPDVASKLGKETK